MESPSTCCVCYANPTVTPFTGCRMSHPPPESTMPPSSTGAIPHSPRPELIIPYSWMKSTTRTPAARIGWSSEDGYWNGFSRDEQASILRNWADIHHGRRISMSQLLLGSGLWLRGFPFHVSMGKLKPTWSHKLEPSQGEYLDIGDLEWADVCSSNHTMKTDLNEDKEHGEN